MRRISELFDMEDNWFPALSLPECIPDGCVYMHAAAYEFGTMMDGGVKSKEHETVYTGTLYISIHLLLMQQPQHWDSGTLGWRPNESWVIFHVESQSSSPSCHTSLRPDFFIRFASVFCVLLFPSLLPSFALPFPLLSSFLFNYLFPIPFFIVSFPFPFVLLHHPCVSSGFFSIYHLVCLCETSVTSHELF